MLEEEGRKLARSRLKYKLAPLALYAGKLQNGMSIGVLDVTDGEVETRV